LLARKAFGIPRKVVLGLGTIVTPDTFLRWRQLIVRTFDFNHRRKPGRPRTMRIIRPPSDSQRMQRTRRLVPAGVAVALAVIGAVPARADPEVQALAFATGGIVLAAIFVDNSVHEEPNYVALEGGRFDPVKNVQQATAFGAEYRSNGAVWWKLRPFVGAGFTSSQSVYGYGGIRLATYWGQHVVIAPSFAIGGYSRGEGKDVGNPPVLGRFGLDFEYALERDVRVGLAYHHMSNGKLLGQTNNPGTEIVGLTISIPLR
jgi:lipid A 3-O-deacylase